MSHRLSLSHCQMGRTFFMSSRQETINDDRLKAAVSITRCAYCAHSASRMRGLARGPGGQIIDRR